MGSNNQKGPAEGFIKIVREEVVAIIEGNDLFDDEVMQKAHEAAPVVLKQYSEEGLLLNQITMER